VSESEIKVVLADFSHARRKRDMIIGTEDYLPPEIEKPWLADSYRSGKTVKNILKLLTLSRIKGLEKVVEDFMSIDLSKRELSDLIPKLNKVCNCGF